MSEPEPVGPCLQELFGLFRPLSELPDYELVSADEVPELRPLVESGLAAADGSRLRLTDAGLELSDAIGPRLYSTRVRELMRAYELH